MIEHADGKVLVSQDGPVTIVTINRPQVKNACDVETVQTLHDVFAAFEVDEAARVAVLTGSDGAFCAGADLAELASGASLGYCWAGTDRGATRRRLSKPVIAAVAGHAFGGHFNGFIGKLVGIGVHRIGPLGENPFPEMIAELALESTTLDTQP